MLADGTITTERGIDTSNVTSASRVGERGVGDIKLQCICPHLALKRRPTTSAFPALLGEQRKCPGDCQSGANVPLRKSSNVD